MNRNWLSIAAPIATLTLLSLNGCSLLRNVSADPADSAASSNEVVTVTAPAPAPTTASGVAEAAVSLVQGTAGKDGVLVDRSDLKKYEKVSIDLAFADVLVTSNSSLRKGNMRVQLLKGDAKTCKIYVTDSESVLQIGDKPASASSHASLSATAKMLAARTPMPTSLKCRYAVEVSLREPASLSVNVTRGAIAVENWVAPTTLSLDWGDIDVGAVGSLNVKCGRCTLAGEDVSGSLKFALENGNVGLSGLVGSAEGHTYGDTILKWRRVKPDASVKLVSKAGDVILTFPGGVPLDLELRAPRGDVYTPKNKNSSRSGIPVTVTAESGNVRLYHLSANPSQ